MLNKFKFLYLLLMSLATLSHAEIWPSVPYDYRLRVSDNGNIWLYNGIVYHSVQYCRYTKVENYPNNPPKFDTTSFKINSFYSFVDPSTKGPSAYDTDLRDPGYLAKYLGFDSIPCPEDSSRTCYNMKYETYTNATLPNEPSSIDCVSCETTSGKYFDSTSGSCVTKCEGITNQFDRLDCMCKRAGKIGYTGKLTTMNIGGDGSFVCAYRCKTTKDDPEARTGETGEFSVSYTIRDTDPNANGVCFADDTYAPNAVPAPNPKPNPGEDDPKPKPNPDKPDKPNPDNPNPGGGGGKPGGGGNKPDKPGDNNPGGDGGGKPGDKEDKNNPNMDFSGYDKLTKGVEKGVGKVMGMYDDAKKQLMGTYDKIKNGSLHDFKHRGFVGSCPYTRDFVIREGLTKKITVDICAVVKDARPVLYFIFYAVFSTIFSILLFKIIIRLI